NAPWAASVRDSGSGRELTDLTSAEQSGMLARLYHAAALYWQAANGGDKSHLNQAADEFDTLFNGLGQHIEALEAKYGQGLAFGLAGDHAKAIEAFKVVLALPLAGCAENTRRLGDGIRQSA